MSLLVSVAVICLTLATCDLLRRQILSLGPSLPASLALDFLTSAELCTAALELGAVLDHNGFLVWSAGLVLMTVYQVLRWRDCAFPTPCLHLNDALLVGSKGPLEVLLRSGVLLASGLLSYRLVSAVWRLELSAAHVGRPGALDSCSIPWSSEVPLTHSFVAEVLGSTFLGIAPRLVLDNPTLSNNDAVVGALVVGLLVLLAVTCAMNFSGGMFNPMLASVLLGGCEGHSMAEHVIVYWVGAAVGAAVAFKAYPTVKRVVYGDGDERKEGHKKEA